MNGYSDVEVRVPVLTRDSVYSRSYLGQYLEYCKICDEVRLLTNDARERVVSIMLRYMDHDLLQRLLTLIWRRLSTL